MKLTFFFLFIFINSSFYSQAPITSEILDKIESTEKNTIKRFDYIMNLAELYRPFPYSKELELRGMPKNHLMFAQEALTWAEKYGNITQLGKAKRFLIDYYCYDDDILSFIPLANEMINSNNFASLQDKHFVYFKLCEVYKEIGLLKEYIELTPTLYQTARSLKLTSSNSHDEYNHIALAYYKLKDFKTARYYFRKSMIKLKEAKRPFAEASVCNNIGLSFSKEEKLDSARIYFNKSLEILKLANAEKEGFGTNSYNQHFKNIILSNLAYTNIHNGHYNQAIAAIKMELKSSIIENETNTEIQAYQKLAFLNYKKKNYAKALKYLESANKKIRLGTDNIFRLNYWDLKAKILLIEGFQEKSDSLFLLKNVLQDSIASIETKRTARVASILYDVKKKDLEIKSQQTNIALLRSKNKIRQQLIIFGGFGLMVIFGFIILIKSRNSAKRSQRLQENFAQELITAQENERNRVALDLHDSVGQQLMLLTRKSKSIGSLELQSLASSTLDKLRSISRNLHPSIIEQLGFTAAVEELINRIDEETEIFFTMDIENIDSKLSKRNVLHLYRIIQELLSNILKHSKSKSAEISIKKSKHTLILIVKDNGIGFNTNKKNLVLKTLGMKSIKERCKILNAQLTISSKPNLGTKVTIAIQL